MLITGIGSDIVQIKRIRHVMQRQPERFPQRILTSIEQQELEQSHNKIRFLAKRYAAKEAIAKALGTGFRQGVSWQDMQIEHDALGRPQVLLSGRALAISTATNIKQVLLTISDEQDYVLAFVVMQA